MNRTESANQGACAHLLFQEIILCPRLKSLYAFMFILKYGENNNSEMGRNSHKTRNDIGFIKR